MVYSHIKIENAIDFVIVIIQELQQLVVIILNQL